MRNICLQFFSHDRRKRALGNHSARLGGGELELFPDHPLQTWYLSKPHKHICVHFCPVWIFTELTKKFGILAYFTQTSGIFTELTQKLAFFGVNALFLFIMFVMIDLLCLSCLCLCSSCFIMFIMLIYCAYRVEQSHSSELLSRKTFLGKEK